jgi:N-acetyl-1-D-myo-inositol-2-amino-2-deoxy-alpha-D-glucopyranoside deacetylase
VSKSQPVILAVLAHPDDESFGLGGTLALYVRRGAAVYYVCATRGEAGTVDPEYMKNYQSVGELREAELKCAAEQLGLKDVFFLGYRDSGMPGMQANQDPNAQINHSLDEVAGKVVRYIRELKPDIVITFDPIGGYRHPDHIHIHKATVLAFEKADDAAFHPESGAPFKPRALYFHVFPHRALRLATRVMPLIGVDPRKFGRNKDIDLKALVEFEFPIHARLNVESVAAVKTAAGACHASQGGVQMRRGLLGLTTRLFGEYDNYMRAYPPVDGSPQVVTDLFEGV